MTSRRSPRAKPAQAERARDAKLEIPPILAKARRSLAAARRLAADDDADFAASRAYFAMVYCAQALLLSRGATDLKPNAIIVALGRDLVRPGLFAAEHHAALRTAYDERNVADYGFDGPFPRALADRMIARAEAFASDAERLLRES